MTGNFVFDIDDTLTVAQSEKEHERLAPQVRELLGDEFYERHVIEPIAEYPHYIFPGFYALFQWLHSKGAKLFFFSSGVERRNIPFAQQFMEKAFGDNPPEYKVFSREHCIDTTYLRDEEKEVYQSYSYGQRKKKMGGIVVPEEELPQTLLIEDDHSYMTKGEEYNLVWIGSGYGYLPSRPNPDKQDKYYQNRLFDNIQWFHKSFYLAGLFSKIFEVQAQKNCTLVEATQEVQMEGNSLSKNELPYKSLRRLQYQIEGQKILSELDPSLVFHFELPDGDIEW
jgi:hypothetical protein